jgi:hypothetical protein
MRKLFKKWFVKKHEPINAREDESLVFLAVIGREYIQHCKEDREFRRKMEKTKFGNLIKEYIKHMKG